MVASLRGTHLRGVTFSTLTAPPAPYQTTINGNLGSMAFASDYIADYPTITGISSSLAWLSGTPGGVTYPTPPNDQLPGSWLATAATLSNSNKTVTFSAGPSSAISDSGALFSLTQEYVAEVTVGQASTTFMVGTFSAGSPAYTGPDNFYGFNPDTYDGNAYLSYFAYYQNDGLIGGSFNASPFTVGDVIGIVLVKNVNDGNLVYFYKNGVPQNPANPIVGFAFDTAGISVGISI